jgi:hypothetical protein
MEVAATLTVWLSFGAWLFLQTLRAPRAFGRVAIALCGAELLACAIWSFGSETCATRPCAPLPETARTAAALDIPTLTAIALVLGAIYGVRAASRVRD